MVNPINISCHDQILLQADKSENVLRNYFQEYYRNWKADQIDIVSSREIGYIPFFGTMIRHRAVLNLTSLTEMFQRIVPRHAYYSSAYYRRPEDKIMKDKGWLGAELIFDLDADHLAGAEIMSYEEILSEVKKHTERLIFRFLMDEMGFQEKDLKVFFSGGRGYHVHVVEDSVYGLSSDSRREIANYIRGEGLISHDLRRSMQEAGHFLGGWKSEMDRRFVSFISEMNELEEPSPELISVFGNRRTATSYLRSLGKQVNKEKPVKKGELFTRPGGEKYRYMDKNDEAVLEFLLREAKSEMVCEIDEPVTTDIHRLIRTPGSLHGKTGFIVKNIPVQDFREFDPLRDGINDDFDRHKSRVEIQRPVNVRIKNENYKFSPGEEEVPGSVAVYLVSARFAKFI